MPTGPVRGEKRQEEGQLNQDKVTSFELTVFCFVLLFLSHYQVAAAESCFKCMFSTSMFSIQYREKPYINKT